MRLEEATQEQLSQMIAWFSELGEVSTYAESKYRYPVTYETFLADVKLNDLYSYSMLDENDNFIAFGQFYYRAGCCHMGRIVVSPGHRNKGIGTQLIRLLIEKGCHELDVKTFALFAMDKNIRAVKTYQSMGFVITDYPEETSLRNFIYMTRNQDT
jgi:ribosomal protein S18 acetylase RimI-like enzyme